MEWIALPNFPFFILTPVIVFLTSELSQTFVQTLNHFLRTYLKVRPFDINKFLIFIYNKHPSEQVFKVTLYNYLSVSWVTIHNWAKKFRAPFFCKHDRKHWPNKCSFKEEQICVCKTIEDKWKNIESVIKLLKVIYQNYCKQRTIHTDKPKKISK